MLVLAVSAPTAHAEQGTGAGGDSGAKLNRVPPASKSENGPRSPADRPPAAERPRSDDGEDGPPSFGGGGCPYRGQQLELIV